MTGIARVEEIEDGLATPRRPPPKAFNRSRPRRLRRPLHLMSLVLLQPSSHPKRQIDQFSRFCTAHGRVPVIYNGRPYPPKLPLPTEIWTHMYYDSLGPSEPTSKWYLSRFSHFCTDNHRTTPGGVRLQMAFSRTGYKK